MTTPQERGLEFEKELAEELGLEQVPGSGSVWHSKLDLSGSEARWSLKFTANASFPIKFWDIVEALEACYGPGGDGSTPIWAARIEQLNEDFIILRKNDFIDIQKGDIKFINEIPTKAAEREARSKVPELLR